MRCKLSISLLRTKVFRNRRNTLQIAVQPENNTLQTSVKTNEAPTQTMNFIDKITLACILFTTISNSYILRSLGAEVDSDSEGLKGSRKHIQDSRNNRKNAEDQLDRSRMRFLRYRMANKISPFSNEKTVASRSESEYKRVKTHVRKNRSTVQNSMFNNKVDAIDETGVSDSFDPRDPHCLGFVTEDVEIDDELWFKFKSSFDFRLFSTMF